MGYIVFTNKNKPVEENNILLGQKTERRYINDSVIIKTNSTIVDEYLEKKKQQQLEKEIDAAAETAIKKALDNLF